MAVTPLFDERDGTARSTNMLTHFHKYVCRAGSAVADRVRQNRLGEQVFKQLSRKEPVDMQYKVQLVAALLRNSSQ